MPASPAPEREWWKDAVFYEIYVRSFSDSDGDGVGDLDGIRARLPYLRELGVDALWLTPFYPSPGVDHGYDVSDYVGVDPQFGTLEDFDVLVADAHALGLRVTVDVVPNHTSDQHPWFRDQPEYYVWADEPNNWPSTFGGSAWTFDEERGRYYLHLFAPEQPDLDWHNPAVQEEFDRILRFWLDRGVDGFRIDVAYALFKDPELRDEEEPLPSMPSPPDWRRSIDRPELHPLYREWRRIVDEYDGDRVLVGELTFLDPARNLPYLRPDELHLGFNFTFLLADWDESSLRQAIDLSRETLAPSEPTWVLENHDVTRLPTRWGPHAARAAALLLLGLPGPVFLYAGQELGLEEVDLPDPLRQDPVFFRTNGARKGRDGCRIPLPWEGQAPPFGFTTGEPWLPLPGDWRGLTVAVQERDPASALSLYRAALASRPRDEGFAWRDSPPGSLAFERGEMICVVNVDAPAVELPDGELVLASASDVTTSLPPGTAAWVRPKGTE